MAYNRENLLRRIIEVQKIVLDQKRHDTPQTKIYEKFIKKQFHISYSTFNNWLATPAHAQLDRLRAKKEKEAAAKAMQTSLWD